MCVCVLEWMLEEMEKRSLWHIDVLTILLAFQKIISSMESNWDFPGGGSCRTRLPMQEMQKIWCSIPGLGRSLGVGNG